MVKKKKSPKTLSLYGLKFDYKDYEQIIILITIGSLK